MRLGLVVLVGLAPFAAAWGAACTGSVIGTSRGGGAGGGGVVSSAGSAAPVTGSGGGAGSGGAGGGIVLATPPPPGPPVAPDGPATITFAVRRLYLGDTDPDGTPDTMNGWKHYGYNLDGVPPGDLGAMCKAVDVAPPALVHEEGPGGVENSFGHDLVPVFLGVASDTPATLDASIASGAFTFLISLDHLGTAAGYDPIFAQIAAGGVLGSAPAFDGSDVWPAIEGSAVSLPGSYLTGDTWVSGAPASFDLPIQLWGGTLVLPLRHAVVTMKLDAAHQGATHGIIAGVLPTQPFLQSFGTLLFQVDPTLCNVVDESIVAQLTQASDILQDGTQDPAAPCDGISIGLGFDAALVQLGPAVPPPPPPPSPCGG